MLDLATKTWESPFMNNKLATTRLDARRRAVFPPVFQAGDTLINEVIDEKTVVFRLIERRKVPEAQISQKGSQLYIRQQTRDY